MRKIRARAITEAEHEEVIAILSFRDALIVRIMNDTGLRVSDVLNLPAELPSCITEIKTGKERPIAVSDTTRELVDAYRKKNNLDGQQHLFSIDRSTVYRSIKNAADALGLKNISPHSWRKKFARAWLAKYGLEATQKILNHRDLGTTLLYVAEI